MQLCRVPLDGHQLLHHQYPYLNPLMTAEIIAPIGAKTKTRYSECSLSELDRLAQSCDGESQVQDGVLDAENPYHPHPAHIASHSGARSDLDGKPRKAMRKYMHIVSESFLLLRLAVQLWSFLGLGECSADAR